MQLHKFGHVQIPFQRIHLELTNVCDFACAFCPKEFMTRPYGYLDPDLALAHYYLGRCREAQRDPQRARLAYRNAIEAFGRRPDGKRQAFLEYYPDIPEAAPPSPERPSTRSPPCDGVAMAEKKRILLLNDSTITLEWARLWRTLVGHLDAARPIDWQHAFLDGSFVPAKKGGRGVGKTMAGKGSKIMLLTDGQGLPLGLVVDSAQPHEMRYAAQTIASVKVPQARGRSRTRPEELIADKAYDSVALRQSLHRRGIKVTIPPVHRRERKTPKRGRPIKVGVGFRQRWHIERSNAWMDNCRRLVVRYERKPELYAAFCMLFLAFPPFGSPAQISL